MKIKAHYKLIEICLKTATFISTEKFSISNVVTEILQSNYQVFLWPPVDSESIFITSKIIVLFNEEKKNHLMEHWSLNGYRYETDA